MFDWDAYNRDWKERNKIKKSLLIKFMPKTVHEIVVSAVVRKTRRVEDEAWE